MTQPNDLDLIETLLDPTLANAEASRRGETVVVPPGGVTNEATWLIEFKPVGDGPPAAARVRRLLKAALRSFGLRAVMVRDGGKDAG